MNYPLISEYIEAIKSPEDNFEELTNLRPVLGDDGQPIMTSGNFAVVFKMKDEQSGKMYAVKCFTREQEGRTENYKLIADELEFVSSDYLTPIKYLEKELFVDTEQSNENEFPILLMDWVDGKTIDAFISENRDNRFALEMLAYLFNKMASWLLTQPFAHGDLKTDNIMINNDGQLILVDYDGMFVPSMKGNKASEVGSPGFRHPSRTDKDFNKHIDDFPIALIAMSLKAIALNPSLYSTFGGNDKLLLSEKDIQNISKSQCISCMQSLMYDKEFCTLFGIFTLALANNNISSMFDLFLIKKPQRSDLDKAILKYLKAANYCLDKTKHRAAYSIFKKLATSEDTSIETIGKIKNVCSSSLGENGLGYMYAKGLSVEQDFAKAVDWFRKAADKKFPLAVFNLSVCYSKGEGVEQNKKESERLRNISLKLGCKVASSVVTIYESPYSSSYQSYNDYTLYDYDGIM